MSKLTVLLPIFNEEQFIEATLRSILNQDFDFKLIISDNKSTDRTTEIARDTVSKDHRVEYFLQDKNIGSFSSFSFLTTKIESPYFMTMGGHDLLGEHYFASVLRPLEEDSSVSMSFGMPHKINENSEDQGILSAAVYNFDASNRLSRYLQSIVIMANCTCFHSIVRSAQANGFKLKKTISPDHVFISHFLWQGRLVYSKSAKFFRRYFSSERNSTQSERISGSAEYLSRHEFFNYYIESFRQLYGKEDAVRGYVEMKILGLLEKRWGSIALLPNDLA